MYRDIVYVCIYKNLYLFLLGLSIFHNEKIPRWVGEKCRMKIVIFMFIIKEILSPTSKAGWVLKVSGVEKHLNGTWVCFQWGLQVGGSLVLPSASLPFSTATHDSWEGWKFSKNLWFIRSKFSEDKVPLKYRQFCNRFSRFLQSQVERGWEGLQNHRCCLLSFTSSLTHVFFFWLKNQDRWRWSMQYQPWIQRWNLKQQ